MNCFDPVRRRATIAALVTTAAAATILGAAASPPAFASVSSPGTASMLTSFTGGVRCGGDVCVAYGGTGSSGAIIFYGANGKAFTGHFRMLGPGQYSATSPTRRWAANGLDHSGTGGIFYIKHPLAGFYCVTGFSTNGTRVGRKCEQNT
jgi:hypothetical protein